MKKKIIKNLFTYLFLVIAGTFTLTLSIGFISMTYLIELSIKEQIPFVIGFTVYFYLSLLCYFLSFELMIDILKEIINKSRR